MAERDQKAIIQRLTEQMDKDNLDALILTSGDAVFYATGYASRDLYKNGQTGGTVAVVTKDGRAGIVVSEFARRTAEMAVDGVEIISYPTWIYIEDYAIEGMEKEVQPDLNKTYKLALQFSIQLLFHGHRISLMWPMPILLVRTLHHPLFRRIQESTEAILFVWTVVRH